MLGVGYSFAFLRLLTAYTEFFPDSLYSANAHFNTVFGQGQIFL